MKNELIYSTDDVLRMLDSLLADRGRSWWDNFFADRAKPCPFFVPWPDENLVSYFDSGLLKPGRVLELGCGNGRNAVYMASKGCVVDAVDFSEKAINWATERSSAAGVVVNYRCQSIFDLEFAPRVYDIVYDAGCFHHLPPHRRKTYVELVTSALKSGGFFGLVCFRPEGGGRLTDWEVYEQRKLGGGLGYTEDRLRSIFGGSFSIVELRQMMEIDPSDHLFGRGFLSTIFMQRNSEKANPPRRATAERS